VETVNQIIEDGRPELIETLKRWISVPSLKADAVGDAPFGEQVKACVGHRAGRCESTGLCGT